MSNDTIIKIDRLLWYPLFLLVIINWITATRNKHAVPMSLFVITVAFSILFIAVSAVFNKKMKDDRRFAVRVSQGISLAILSGLYCFVRRYIPAVVFFILEAWPTWGSILVEKLVKKRSA